MARSKPCNIPARPQTGTVLRDKAQESKAKYTKPGKPIAAIRRETVNNGSS